MRSIFLILSLLLTLSVVGVLVKKQLASAPAGVASTPGAAPTLQSPQQTQQQFKQALEAAGQAVKRDADEK